MGEVAMGEVKLSNRIRQNSEAAPWVVDAVKLLEAERDALLAEVAKLTAQERIARALERIADALEKKP